MSRTDVLAVTHAGGEPQWQAMNLPDLGPFDIEVKVTHCGVCASDLHLADGDLDDVAVFPQVCGHEVVGTVQAVGSELAGWQIGERAGIGWQKGACLKCEYCLKGEEQHCAEARLTCCGGEIGGFADTVRCDGRFAYVIPEEISSAEAAPLLCAGHTTYSALMRHTRAGARVGILGIGGLGHLAVQYAAKMGCHVTALSRRGEKAAEAFAYGAHDFLDLSGPSALADAQANFDFLLVTSPAVADWNVLFAMMRPYGIVCVAGMTAPATCDIGAMMERTLTLTTANGGSRAQMLEMLAFSALHGVRPTVETMAMDALPRAFERLRQGKARYRIVLTRNTGAEPVSRPARQSARTPA